MSAVDFDIGRAPRDAESEAAAFRWLRQHDPVHWDERNRWWVVTRHGDLKDVSRQPQLFSSEPHGPWLPFESHFSIQAQDGPGHDRTRKVVSRGFTARQTAYLREGARRYADEAIDAVAASGRCDLVHAVAAPVPVRIVADLLGLDAHDLFARWTRAVEHMVAGVVSHPDEDAEAVAAFEAYIRDVVVRRTRDPGDDLISTMIRARGEGVFESFERETFPGVPPGDGVMGFISFLVLAGSETTRHAIALGMLALMEHPDQRQRLRDDPSLIADAAEEILRVSSPVRTMQRTVMADTELGGRQLRAGDLVVLAYGSANHDEAVFDEPDRFRIDRRPNDHVSFGFGSHFCLGANVARLEIAEVVGALVERLPDLALDPAAPVVRLRSPILNGLTRLPVVFTPTA